MLNMISGTTFVSTTGEWPSVSPIRVSLSLCIEFWEKANSARLPGRGSGTPHPSLLHPAGMEPGDVSLKKAAPPSGEVLESDTRVPKPQHILWHVPSPQLAEAEQPPMMLSSLNRLGLFPLVSMTLISSVCELMLALDLCREAFALFCYFNRSFSWLFGWSYPLWCEQFKASGSSVVPERESALIVFAIARQHLPE